MDSVKLKPKIVGYFKAMKVVILEPNSSAKISIRKTLTEIGVDSKNIFVVNQLNEMKQKINDERPNIIFTVDHFKGLSCLDFIDHHLKIRPNRLNAAFIIISSYNSLASASEIGEYEVDLMVTRPFNQKHLMDKLLDIFSEKIDPPPYLRATEQGRKHLFVGEFDLAREKLLQAVEINPKKTSSHYYLGVVEIKLGNVTEAIGDFEQVLKIDLVHFKALIALFDIKFSQHQFIEALSFARRILKNYPINPRRLEQFIRLAVVTKSYNDVVNYCELSKEITFDESIEKSISAGLAICAKHLIHEDEDRKLTELCLKYASRYCHKFPKVCLSVVESLIALGDIKNADTILFKLINEEGYKAMDALTLEFEILYHQGEYLKALALGMKILKSKNASVRVYKFAIKSSIRINRSPEFVLDLYDEGIYNYPELEEMKDLVQSFTGKVLGET